MKTEKIRTITFDTEETIVASTTSGENHIVMLMSSGDVIRYEFDAPSGEYLFSVKSRFTFKDGDFDLQGKTTIYTLDQIVVVANDYTRHCYVHYPGKYQSLHLWRGDYHANISRYPIALFKNNEGIPHLIYAQAWNHVQIMNLDTRQILTAAKSLITENAEQQHIDFYSSHSEENKLAWPTPYDYFFGKLSLSPDSQKFLSAGWVWGSSDCYNVFDIQQFIESNRISYLNINYWEHENRAVCWIDDNTVAIAYNPLTDEQNEMAAPPDSPWEMHIYSISTGEAEIIRKIPFAEKDILQSNIYYEQAGDSIVAFSEESGVHVLSLKSEMVWRDETIRPNEYNPVTGLLTATEGRTVTIYKIRS